MKVLVIGAGGVGCEVLYALTRCPFASLKIAVIDYDRIEVTNLHRQFLYRTEDIGKSKAQVAAQRLQEHQPPGASWSVSGIDARIEDIDDLEFFRQFRVFVIAVDNLETRRWINSMVVRGLEDSNERIIVIDIGTEGFKGSIRIWRKFRENDACLECTMGLFTEGDWRLPVCSLTGRPTSFRQCIQWAAWSDDGRQGTTEIVNKAVERAQQYGITLPSNDQLELAELVESTLQRTVPAVAAVNSLLAALAIDKLSNILSTSDDGPGEDDNFCMINAETGIYQLWTRLERDQNCLICGSANTKQ